jgi:putative peptidoglycan lipid II flippase
VLLKSVFKVGSWTFLSRILGFVRDMVVARFFGAGMAADAFFVAFKIPNFLRRLFAEGAFSQAFVPVLAGVKEEQGKEGVRQFIAAMSGRFALILFLVTLLGVLGAPLIIGLFAPGFLDTPEKFDLTVSLLQITFPYLLFISLTALAGALLNTYGHFSVPAFTPVLLNLSLIGAAIYLSPYFEQPIFALAWGVFIAGVAQLLLQLPFLFRLGLLPKPSFRKHQQVNETGRLMIPALFGVSVSQINLLLDTLLASFLVTGSVAWLYYSDRLMEFPLGLLGIALATVVLPSLSAEKAAQNDQAFRGILEWALRLALILAMPAMLGLVILAGPLLTTLFQYGAFTTRDVEMASGSLMAYSVGLLAFVLIKILAPGYYARKDIKTPVKIGIWAMVANMVFNLMLIFPLAHVGLALATSLSAFLNAGLLAWGLMKLGYLRWSREWAVTLLQVSFASGLMASGLLFFTPEISVWFGWTWEVRLGTLLALVGAAVLVYFVALKLAGVDLRRLER